MAVFAGVVKQTASCGGALASSAFERTYSGPMRVPPVSGGPPLPRCGVLSWWKPHGPAVEAPFAGVMVLGVAVPAEPRVQDLVDVDAINIVRRRAGILIFLPFQPGVSLARTRSRDPWGVNGWPIDADVGKRSRCRLGHRHDATFSPPLIKAVDSALAPLSQIRRHRLQVTHSQRGPPQSSPVTTSGTSSSLTLAPLPRRRPQSCQSDNSCAPAPCCCHFLCSCILQLVFNYSQQFEKLSTVDIC